MPAPLLCGVNTQACYHVGDPEQDLTTSNPEVVTQHWQPIRVVLSLWGSDSQPSVFESLGDPLRVVLAQGPS